MIFIRLVSLTLVALSVSALGGQSASADEQQELVPGISIADPNAGWVEVSPDTTLAPSQDTNVAADSGEKSEQ
ncbi:MAG: hypothetical protein K2Q28_10660 [Hyphomicrobium sp.]|nr:hypothetical protein [Hyphomicrobium sp.]